MGQAVSEEASYGIPAPETVVSHAANFPVTDARGRSLGGKWLVSSPMPYGQKHLSLMDLRVEDGEVMIQNGITFWQPLSGTKWAAGSAFVARQADGLPIGAEPIDESEPPGAPSSEEVERHCELHGAEDGSLWLVSYPRDSRLYGRPHLASLAVRDGIVCEKEMGKWVPLETSGFKRPGAVEKLRFLPLDREARPVYVAKNNLNQLS